MINFFFKKVKTMKQLRLGQRSFFMIKPNSMQNKKDILLYIRKYFEIQDLKTAFLTEDFLGKLYGSEPNISIKYINIGLMVGQKAMLGIVIGDNCPKRFLELCGHDYRPDFCSHGSIRYRYSVFRQPIRLGNIVYYCNAIHRSLPCEAEDEVLLYLNYFA